MKKIYIGLLSVFCLLLTTSCSDFLDEKSRDKIDAEDQEIITAEQLLTGAYGQFQSWDYAFSYLGITEIISDNADKGSSSGDNGGDKADLDNLTYTTSAGSFFSMWTRWYKAIGRATQSIEYTQKANLSDKTLEARYIGEARFLRALNYFYLVRGWGEVPIQSIDLIKRQPVEDVYKIIIEDLLYAETNLPVASGYASKDKGRATKGAAQGLLAKVYLYQKNYEKSLEYANKVISSGEYSLMPTYIDVFKSENHNSKESVFEFQAVAATENSIAQGIQQYSQTQGARAGSNSWGWGFNTPSDDLLAAFNSENDTIRRNATIIFRNGTLWDGRAIGNTENPMYNYKAYTTNSPGASQNDKSIIYMRYSEILLIKAEAANELGQIADALSSVNQVRNRAKLSNLTVTDQTALRKAIWNERRLELAMEHDRWFDLIRTRQAATIMLAQGKPFSEKNWLFPIPNNQLVQTPSIIQNAGW